MRIIYYYEFLKMMKFSARELPNERVNILWEEILM